MFAGISQLVCTAYHQRIIGYVNDSFQPWHLGGIDLCDNHIADKEELRIRMVHYVMNLLRKELMQDGNSYGTIGKHGQESSSPG